MKYKVTPVCEQCDKTGKFSLKEYTVVVYTEIHLLEKYETTDVEAFAIFSEDQHAEDYKEWGNSDEVKKTMEKIESKNSKRTYKTDELCIEDTTKKFFEEDLLNRKAKDAVLATINKYDKKVNGNDPIHTYPGEGNWGK